MPSDGKPSRGPYSPAQQRFEFAMAREGVPWAMRKVKRAPTMRVQAVGQQLAPRPQFDKGKAKLLGEGRRVRKQRKRARKA